MGELAGRQLLLLGFGRIGREVARRALGFDMKVAVYDPYVSGDDIRTAGCEPVEDWRAELPEADVLSLRLPLREKTCGLIGAAELGKMKPTAILVNAARGGLVDEDALHDALSGRMARGGAGIDCFEKEPVGSDLPLLSLPNVVLSPHSAALSAETAQRVGEVAACNIIDGLNRRLDPALVFNRRQLNKAGYEL